MSIKRKTATGWQFDGILQIMMPYTQEHDDDFTLRHYTGDVMEWEDQDDSADQE